MKKKFAYILMGGYTPEQHQTCFETRDRLTYIYTVTSPEQAFDKVRSLVENGFGAIELCGAFGRERARQLIELTGNRCVISYAVHEPEQHDMCLRFFARPD